MPKSMEFTPNRLVSEIFGTLECTEELTRTFICTVLADIRLFDHKQHDRGPENIAQYGEKGVLIRCTDKLARIKRIVWDDVEPAVSESVEAEWADLSVYGVIARMVRGGNWPNAPAAGEVAPTPFLPYLPDYPAVTPHVGIGTKVRRVSDGALGVVIDEAPQNRRCRFRVWFNGARAGTWWFKEIPGTTDEVSVELA